MSICSSVKPFPGAGYKGVPGVGGVGVPSGTDVAPPPPWEGRAIATHKLRLVEFSAFVEHPRDPETVSWRTFNSVQNVVLVGCCMAAEYLAEYSVFINNPQSPSKIY